MENSGPPQQADASDECIGCRKEAQRPACMEMPERYTPGLLVFRQHQAGNQEA